MNKFIHAVKIQNFYSTKILDTCMQLAINIKALNYNELHVLTFFTPDGSTMDHTDRQAFYDYTGYN